MTTPYPSLIFDLSRPGRRGSDHWESPAEMECNLDIPPIPPLPEGLLRSTPPALPEVAEPTVIRHYHRLAGLNYCLDSGFYPLGSCTMKYNPRINERLASHEVFRHSHPYSPDCLLQAQYSIYYELAQMLCVICGMKEFTLNPYAGAHGEFTGLLVIRRYHELRGDAGRDVVLVPDSAHGTNPASAAMAGYKVVEVKSGADGCVDIEDLKAKLSPSVAAMMMTNPNTAGIFEKDILEICRLVHEAGGLMYYDGANLNALLGVARPGDMGFDVMHVNLHKTFAAPHGGGGPGAGPVGVREGLEGLLPLPRLMSGEDFEETAVRDRSELPDTLGSVTPTLGNFAVLVKAQNYILSLGEAILKVGPYSVLAANYIRENLKDLYELPLPGPCMHEVVFDGLKDKSTGVTTLHIAKRLLDKGFHAPTIYFPLLFHESLMVEPTESEPKETLDEFIAAMREIALEARENPELVKTAPHDTPFSLPDEAEAATHPLLTFFDLKSV